MNIPPKYEDVVAQLGEATDVIEYMRKERVRAERREAALLEELESYRKSYVTRFVYDALQQRLTVAEQLLRRVIACGELTRINHAELEVDVCKWLEPVTSAEPVTFGNEYNNLSVAERSAIQVTARIQEVAALKPAEEGEGS